MQNDQLDKAIDSYLKAIEIDNTNNIYYSNCAFAYFLKEQFDLALTQINKSIEINDKYPKAYLRKGQILLETNRAEEARDALKIGLQLDPNNEEIKSWMQKAETEIKADNIIPKDDPEYLKITNLINWLQSGKSEFPKIKLRYYEKDYRGVHAS